MMVLLIALMLLAEPPALAVARGHLNAGKLDDVLLDLEGQAFDDAQAPAAADVLAQAAQAAQRKQDLVLALSLVERALKLKGDQPLALEVGARTSRAQKLYTPAEEYADRWIKTGVAEPKARLLRAELSTDQGDWAPALEMANAVRERDLGAEERARLRLVKSTCQENVKQQRLAMSEVKSLQTRLDAAAERVKRMPDAHLRDAAGSGARADVILYGTSWCPVCAQARAYLQARRVAFTDLDVESDREAADEMAEKLAHLHARRSSVPVIDVRGKVMQGFSPTWLERVLR